MNTSESLAQMTATQLLPLFRKKELSPVEVLKSVFERIDALGERFHPFCYLDRADAMAAAATWVNTKPQERTLHINAHTDWECATA